MQAAPDFLAATTASLPDQGAVAHMRRDEERPYLCVAQDVERASIQPLRVATSLVGVPILGLAAWRLRKTDPTLATAVAAVAAGVGVYTLVIFGKADAEMERAGSTRTRGALANIAHAAGRVPLWLYAGAVGLAAGYGAGTRGRG